MGGDRTIRGLVGTSPEAAQAVRRVVASWRALTGGAMVRDSARKTLIACSGGADSMALVVALGSASGEVVVGHVVHDMRARTEAEASRDAAAALARRLGMRFEVAEIRAKGTGNYEANARRERYAALAAMARATGCAFVATGHHAEDQLETVLMRLLRGAGPRGLGGLARKRRLGGDGASVDNTPLMLIRPMLSIGRDDARRICAATETTWHEDHTNTDTASFRNALRHRVLPILNELAPKGAHAAVAAADLLRQAAALVEMRAREVLARADRATRLGELSLSWERLAIHREEAIVLGEVVRLAADELGVGSIGADARNGRGVGAVVAAIRDASTEPREFVVGGLALSVDAHDVVIRPLS